VTESLRLPDAARGHLLDFMARGREVGDPGVLWQPPAWKMAASRRWKDLTLLMRRTILEAPPEHDRHLEAAVGEILEAIGVNKPARVVGIRDRVMRSRVEAGLYGAAALYRALDPLHAAATQFIRVNGLTRILGDKIMEVAGFRSALDRAFLSRVLVNDVGGEDAYSNHFRIVIQRLRRLSGGSLAVFLPVYGLFRESIGCNGGMLMRGQWRIGRSDDTPDLLLRAVERGLGWLVETPKTILCVARPRVKLDEQWRLHAEHSAALHWPDGVSEFNWHGVRVDSRLILHPDQLRAGEILAEKNLEIRRIMIERFGVERLLSEAGASLVDSDIDAGGERALFHVTRRSGEPLSFLKVRCPSTLRSYLIQMPPTARSCREAAAWSFGMEMDEYAPLRES
jgi:hypothetical protein